MTISIQDVLIELEKSKIKKNFGITMNVELHKDIKEYCELTDQTISGILSELLINFLLEQGYITYDKYHDSTLYEYIKGNYNKLSNLDITKLMTSFKITPEENDKIYNLWLKCGNNEY